MKIHDVEYVGEVTDANKADIEQAVNEIRNYVSGFNREVELWEDQRQMGVNFRFRYDEKTGRKKLAISDVSQRRTDTPTPESVVSAGTTLNKIVTEDTAKTPADQDLAIISSQNVLSRSLVSLGGGCEHLQVKDDEVVLRLPKLVWETFGESVTKAYRQISNETK